MKEKNYFKILVVFGILCHGIIGNCAESNINESSKLLVRNKRLLSEVPEAIEKLPINQVRYVVQVQKNNNNTCVGSILLAQVILTAAHCLHDPHANYHVLSESVLMDQGKFHHIRNIVRHPEYHISKYVNDLALLYIEPHIDTVHSPHRLIIMHSGFVPPNTLGLVSGWGCIAEGRNGHGMIYPKELRSILTHTITTEKCGRFHNNRRHTPYLITDKNICTQDKISRNRCGDGDSGAPLVISKHLVGIMAWSTDDAGDPDVFMNIAYPGYRDWIIRNLPPNPFYTAVHAESSHSSSPVREPCVKKSWNSCFGLKH